MAVYLDVVSSGHREHDVDGDGWLGERTSTAIIVRGCSRLFEVVRKVAQDGIRSGGGVGGCDSGTAGTAGRGPTGGLVRRVGVPGGAGGVDDPSGRQQGR